MATAKQDTLVEGAWRPDVDSRPRFWFDAHFAVFDAHVVARDAVVEEFVCPSYQSVNASAYQYIRGVTSVVIQE